jgi:hypothetical protein
MIQPISGPGFIIIGAEIPAVIGNRDPKLPFDIPLTVQGSKGEILVICETEERARGRHQRRGLVVVTVKSSKDPMQARNLQSDAHPRVGCVL